jgi:large subunit ribosomal protein L54
MICNACRRTILLSLRASRETRHSQLRSISTSPATPHAAPSILPPGSPASVAVAASTSTPAPSQPPSTLDSASNTATANQPSKPKSSIPGGAVLQGIAYLKGKPSVLAKEDSEYPAWLWMLLDDGKSGETKVDLSGSPTPCPFCE